MPRAIKERRGGNQNTRALQRMGDTPWENTEATTAECVFDQYVAAQMPMIKALENAFPKLQGHTFKQKFKRARTLINKPRVKRVLAQLRLQFAEYLKMSPGEHLAKLMELRDKSIEADQFTAAVRAEELIGRTMGFHLIQVVHQHEMAVDDAREQLMRLAREHPEVATLIQAQRPHLIEGHAEDVEGKVLAEDLDEVYNTGKTQDPSIKDEDDGNRDTSQCPAKDTGQLRDSGHGVQPVDDLPAE
jgi:hypothetical protein